MSNEAEELLIAWRKRQLASPAGIERKEQAALVEYADKLIAEREPKIMSASEMLDTHDRWLFTNMPGLNAMDLLRTTLLTNIAAVIDKKLYERAQLAGPGHTDGIYLARRIIADILKVRS